MIEILASNNFIKNTEIWNALLKSSYSGINGPDITCSATWANALIESHLPQEKIHYMTITEEGKIKGLFPYFIESDIFKRRVKSLTEVYSGRSSFLVVNGSGALSSKLIQEFSKSIPNWDTLQLTLINNCVAHIALYDEEKSGRSSTRILQTIKSPYIQLKNSWDQTYIALPKKLRWAIRKGEKELTNLGSLSYCEYTKGEEMDELFKIIYTIEKHSWKEKSGSSITTQDKQRKFYEALARYATRDGTLSAHVLLLNNKPLAYILGLLSGDGSFLDLKESFVDSYSKYSPAHVLKNYALPNLINKGVRIYDFMGECEPYKMRWTDKTYERHTIVIYNKTLRGRLAYLKSLLSRNSTPIPPPSELKPALKETGL